VCPDLFGKPCSKPPLWNSSLLKPQLPATLNAGDRVLKAISNGIITNHTDCSNPRFLHEAQVLTIVGDVPPQDSFRPPYHGPYSPPTHTLADVAIGSLGSVDPPPGLPSGGLPPLDWVIERWAPLQMDHLASDSMLIPTWNFREGDEFSQFFDGGTYGADIARNTAAGALRLLLNSESVEQRRNASIGYVQYGLDLAGILRGAISGDCPLPMNFGGTKIPVLTAWFGRGGYGSGRRLPIAFAAAALNDAELREMLRAPPPTTFQEDDLLQRNALGEPIFGSDFRPMVSDNDQYHRAYW